MPDRDSPDTKPTVNNQGHSVFSRRAFLGRSAAAGVSVAARGLLAPVTMAAAGTEQPTSTSGPLAAKKDDEVESHFQRESLHSHPEFDWRRAYKLLEALPTPNPSASLVKGMIRSQIELMQHAYEPRIDRVNQLIALADLDHPTPNSLADNLRKALGGLAEDRELLEDSLPFFQQKKYMLRTFNKLRDNLTAFSELSRDTTNFLIEYFDLSNSLAADLQYQFQRFGFEKQAAIKGQTQILMDPQLKTGVDGYRLFTQDSERVSDFLRKLPFLKKFAQRIILTSKRYGFPFANNGSLNEDQAGTFHSERDSWQERHLGVVVVDMDHGPSNYYWPEFTFAHENGHLTSIFLNPDFEDGLEPQEVIERYNYELQIFNNPDWGDHGRTIPQLFRGGPSMRSDNLFITQAEHIYTDQFVTLTQEYPGNVILLNDAPGHSQPTAIVDGVKGFDLSKPFNYPGARVDESIKFNSMDEFLQVYLPVLRKHAAVGSIRAQIVLWAIDNFGDDIKRYTHLWSGYKTFDGYHYVPSHIDNSATTWSNFFNVVVSNAAIVHAVFNNLPEAKKWFGGLYEYDAVKSRVKYLRERYRDELFGEGIGWSYYFGPRMVDKPPYRGALEHAAALVDRREAA